MTSWAAEEFATVELGDKRLNKRLIKIIDRFSDKPTASIPGACNGWAETQAAYRLLGQEGMSCWDILEPHFACTEARARQHPVVLCLQDTTELDFNGQNIAGLGPLSYETQRGMYLHPTLWVTPQREPLGVGDAWMWARESKDAQGKRGGISESKRWTEGLERLCESAARMPQTRLVYVADREADTLEMMQCAHAMGNPVDWLIRSKHNRVLPEGGKLWAAVYQKPMLGEIEFELGQRQGQAARWVRQQVRVCSVELKDGKGGLMRVSCLIAQEINAPAGVKLIEWRLLTNRECTTLEQATELIEWYRARWEIEIFFNVLKNGCRVQALQLGSMAKIELALAIYMVVAWRLVRLTRLARTHPDLPCDELFDELEYQGAFILAKKPVPTTPPTIREMIRQIAMLGGFLGRKGDGEPGVKTLWQGFARLRAFVQSVTLARQYGLT